MSFAFTVIPVPAPILNVLSAANVPPPVNPEPANMLVDVLATVASTSMDLSPDNFPPPVSPSPAVITLPSSAPILFVLLVTTPPMLLLLPIAAAISSNVSNADGAAPTT